MNDKFKGALLWVYFAFPIVNILHTLWSKTVLSVLSVMVLVEFSLPLLRKGSSVGELLDSRTNDTEPLNYSVTIQ